MSDAIPYFCYSSSLDEGAFNEWKRNHGYETFSLPAGQKVVAPGYELVFNLFSHYWGGRVLGLQKSERPGARAEGILFLVPRESWPIIEHKEGLRTGLSESFELSCCHHGGQAFVARAFSTPASRQSLSGPVSPLFRKLVSEAYRRWGLETSLDALT